MMQERYDEAETALKRALVIDPEYTFAKDNLAVLAHSRQAGPPLGVMLKEPFKHSKLNQSLIFTRK